MQNKMLDLQKEMQNKLCHAIAILVATHDHNCGHICLIGSITAKSGWIY